MTPRARRALLVPALVVGTLLAACTATDDPGGDAGSGGAAVAGGLADATTTEAQPAVRFPGDEWDEAPAAEAGFDQAALDALAQEAESAGSTCLAVTRDGVLVDERTWGDLAADEPREAFSVTKSITSTLVGIAQDQGALDIEASASTHIPEWAGTDAEAVTVEHLLSNDSGRHWDLATDYRAMAIAAADKTAFGIGLAQDHEPGEVWAYNNSAIQTLAAVLEDATGEEPAEFAEEHLFAPIGMDDSWMALDPSGGTMTFMGLQTTCRDLARFGYLMLREGRWDGEQVVSPEWVEAATGAPSQELNAAYGYLWWLNRKGPLGAPTIATDGDAAEGAPEGQMVPDAPEDVFWALGLGGQIVAVIPSEGIVAVRMGSAPPADAPFDQGRLTTGVLGALAEG